MLLGKVCLKNVGMGSIRRGFWEKGCLRGVGEGKVRGGRWGYEGLKSAE